MLATSHKSFAFPAVEERINKLWRMGSPIQLVELFQLIAEKARALMRIAITKGWNLKPFDAIHLATADHYKVANFHTYDEGLEKYKELTTNHFPIGPPLAAQPVLPLKAKVENAVESEATPEQTAAPNTAPISGGDGGRSESEAASENKAKG